MRQNPPARTTTGKTKPQMRFRHQFDTTPEERETIERIQRQVGLRTFSEVLRASVRVMEWYVRTKEDGWSILAVKDGETKAIELLL